MTSRSLAVDWSDLETFSRPPPRGTSDCADPEASWGHRKNNLLRDPEAAGPSSLRPERRARLIVDTARAHAQLRHPDDAVSALRQAGEISPELVRGHPVAGQLVADLLAMQNPPSAGLSALSGRITVP